MLEQLVTASSMPALMSILVREDHTLSGLSPTMYALRSAKTSADGQIPRILVHGCSI